MENMSKKFGIPVIASAVAFAVGIGTGWCIFNDSGTANDNVPTVLYQNAPMNSTMPDKFTITTDYINKKLDNISELFAAELSYTGIYTVLEGDIPLLTQKGFSMIYNGEVKAGIDMASVGIDVKEDEVVITLPESEIMLIKIDPSSIQFYDQKKALFNWTDLYDTVDAIACAENDIKNTADIDELLQKSDKQTEIIVRGLLEDIVKDDGRKLVIEHSASETGEAL